MSLVHVPGKSIFINAHSTVSIVSRDTTPSVVISKTLRGECVDSPAKISAIYETLERLRRRLGTQPPLIQAFIDVVRQPDCVNITLSFYPRGDIIEYLMKTPKREIDKVFQLVKDLVFAVMHVHGLWLVHGNIFGGNVMISADGQAVLCDVGVHAAIRYVQGVPHGIHPRWWWQAPECLASGDVSEVLTMSADVFSLARTIEEMLEIHNHSRHLPSLQSSRSHLYKKIEGRLATARLGAMSPALLDILDSCTIVRPRDRETVDGLRARLYSITAADLEY